MKLRTHVSVAAQEIFAFDTAFIDMQGSAAKNNTAEIFTLLKAESVKAYLVAEGIAVARLTTIGFGPAVPVSDNKSELGRARNRRVELVRK